MKKHYLLPIMMIFLQSVQAQWSVEHLSMARSWIGAVTAQNHIYFAGGYIEDVVGTMTRRIDIYDNATGTWSIDSLSAPRGDLGAAYLNNKIFFAIIGRFIC